LTKYLPLIPLTQPHLNLTFFSAIDKAEISGDKGRKRQNHEQGQHPPKKGGNWPLPKRFPDFTGKSQQVNKMANLDSSIPSGLNSFSAWISSSKRDCAEEATLTILAGPGSFE
jgi:hypothetical protein